MSTLRKRLDSVEERTALQQHRELQRQFKGRSEDEQSFFCIHGYWPENAIELPHRIEFTARGIKTIVTSAMGRRGSEAMKHRIMAAPPSQDGPPNSCLNIYRFRMEIEDWQTEEQPVFLGRRHGGIIRR